MDAQGVADRVEIEALRGEFADAVVLRDYERLASLFTPDGAVRIPDIAEAASSREQIRSGVERLQAMWAVFVQQTHAGTIRLDGDTATGRAISARSAGCATAGCTSTTRPTTTATYAHLQRVEVRGACLPTCGTPTPQP